LPIFWGLGDVHIVFEVVQGFWTLVTMAMRVIVKNTCVQKRKSLVIMTEVNISLLQMF
jgi:uncharacterized protein YrrD